MDLRSYLIAELEVGINGVFMCPPIPGLYDMSVEELLVEWEKQRKFIRQSLESPIIPLPPKMDGEVRKIPRLTRDKEKYTTKDMNKERILLRLGKSPDCLHVQIDYYPCWFHRMMMRIVFGFYIVKE